MSTVKPKGKQNSEQKVTRFKLVGKNEAMRQLMSSFQPRRKQNPRRKFYLLYWADSCNIIVLKKVNSKYNERISWDKVVPISKWGTDVKKKGETIKHSAKSHKE